MEQKQKQKENVSKGLTILYLLGKRHVLQLKILNFDKSNLWLSYEN